VGAVGAVGSGSPGSPGGPGVSAPSVGAVVPGSPAAPAGAAAEPVGSGGSGVPGSAGVAVGEVAGAGRGPGWVAIVAALVDGFDVVMVAAGPGVRRRASDVRRLVARVRERGAVLVAVGGDLPGHPGNVRLTVTGAHWEGLGRRDKGYLQRRRVSVVASGRGEASRSRRADLWLPTESGELAPAGPPTIRPVPAPAESAEGRPHRRPRHRAGDRVTTLVPAHQAQARAQARARAQAQAQAQAQAPPRQDEPTEVAG
jgi:hypothetical protein